MPDQDWANVSPISVQKIEIKCSFKPAIHSDFFLIFEISRKYSIVFYLNFHP